jgi:hypothetical protein
MRETTHIWISLLVVVLLGGCIGTDSSDPFETGQVATIAGGNNGDGKADNLASVASWEVVEAADSRPERLHYHIRGLGADGAEVFRAEQFIYPDGQTQLTLTAPEACSIVAQVGWDEVGTSVVATTLENTCQTVDIEELGEQMGLNVSQTDGKADAMADDATVFAVCAAALVATVIIAASGGWAIAIAGVAGFSWGLMCYEEFQDSDGP